MAAVLYTGIASSGFLTFGGHSQSFILKNYSPHDPLATLCRVAIALSTLTIFPIAFIGFRDGALDVMNVPPEQQTSHELNVLTVILLASLTVVATFISDLGVINAFAGGAISTGIVFVFPALMYQKAVDHLSIRASKPGQKREVVFAYGLMVFGVVLGAIGVIEALRDN